MAYILKSNETIESPIPGTPALPDPPDFVSKLLLGYSSNELAIGALSSWAQSSGTRTDGNLSLASTNRPQVIATSNGRNVARFTAANANFIRTEEFSTPVTTSVTMSALVKIASTTNAITSLLTGGASGGVSHLCALELDASGRPQIGAGTTAELIAPTALALNRWYVLTAVFNGAGSAIYVDGQLSIQGTTGAAKPAAVGLGRLTVGTNTGTNVRYFDGSIARINIHGRALSQYDIAALSQAWQAEAPA